MKTTGDQQLVKRINRSALLRLLRAQPGLSRAQLAHESGLTKSTVSLLARELIDEGWLAEDKIANGPGQGRPSTPLRVSATAMGLVGLEVAVDCLRVVCASLTGEVLWCADESLHSHAPSEVCHQAAKLIARAFDAQAQLGLQMLGIGVGLPGALDKASGLVRFAPNLGWRNVDFLSELKRALAACGLPEVVLHIQNEADTAALGEYEFAGGHDDDTLIFVNCDVGVGAGIVLNDHLFTGAQGLAGEIGHSIMQMDGQRCSCGRRGCAETFIGARALARGASRPDGMTHAGQYLGVLLQNLWTTFNPSVLVAGGASCVRHPELVRAAQEALNACAANAGMVAPQVRTARFGLLAPAVGAAAMVLHHQLRPVPAGLHPAAATIA